MKGSEEHTGFCWEQEISNPDAEKPGWSSLARLAEVAFFYLAEHGGSLDEALKFAQHAAQPRKDDATSSDTLGVDIHQENMRDAAVQMFSNQCRSSPVILPCVIISR